ncbi:hypothetical protein KY309_01795 [Candidatus Woesearchaeota archaeon]|nr:hypothetical protein [Candidatus Woesearchaeota archaeon]
MERGATVALIAVVIVGVLAIITIIMPAPTGFIAQGQAVYVTESAPHLAIACKNPQQQVVFLRYDSNYAIFCCLEDMIGQNACRSEKRVLLTRMY